MRTLDRYLAGLFLKNFMLAVFALTALFLFQDLLGALLDHNYPTEQILYYHLLNIPRSSFR